MTPNDPALLNDLGVACLIARRVPEAITWLERSIALRPSFGDTHYNLGLALEQAGQNDAALASHLRAATLSPGAAEPHSHAAEILLRTGKPERAAAEFERAARAAPGTTAGDLSAARGLTLQGRATDAEERLRLLLARDASSADAHLLLGILLAEAGRFDEATASFERSIALAPGSATAYHGLVSSRRLREADRPTVDRIVARIRSQGTPDAARLTLHFAAGKGLEDLGDFAGAIEHFDAANAIRRRLARPFDARDFERRVGRLIARFTPAFFAQSRALGDADETPILVIGMPRSGTTLVERILSSHPAIAGGGELTFWNEHAPAWVEAETDKLAEAASRLRRGYLQLLHGIRPDAARVTDKMPFNFLWIGLVHILFPRARILHCRRNPVDTCLSIYSTLFAQHWGFASDRDDLASYYRQYLRLMEHWRRVLPADRLLDVDYEDVTAAPDRAAQQIVEFSGLSWDTACLQPERNATVVRTASKWQARQPVFRTSVERWRRYEPWIGELRSLLSEPR